MTAPTTVSVVVRAKNEQEGIGRTLELVASQQVEAEVEVIVVDSGSTDRTVEIARRHGARILEIPASSFTYGGALNDGCAAAAGEILVALSAHAYPTDPTWLAAMLEAFEDPAVACASGLSHGPDGTPLRSPVVQDAERARRHPEWGYSNAAGGFRAELWRQRGFRTDMPASEDKEWALHWLDRGHRVVLDPALEVDHDHSKDGMRDQYDRARRDVIGVAMAFGGPPPYPLRQLLRDWWAGWDGYDSALRARLSHRRAARLAGTYMGHRCPISTPKPGFESPDT